MESAQSSSEDLPGLTLYVVQEELSSCAGKSFKAAGKILLSAEVHDLGIFDDVLEKLDGMTIHTVNDVPQALVKAAQRRAKRAEEKMMSLTEDSRNKIDQLEAALSFARQELENYKGQLSQALAANAELTEALRWADEALQSRSQ